jgi:polyisoprenyl-phosphate glycosyltransferase
MENPEYSIIIPVYNSAVMLEELHHGISDVMNSIGKSWELILVDDGSSDESWKIIEKIKGENRDHIIGVRLSANFGQHNATFCGLSYAHGNLIITMDDDLQMMPEDIPLLIAKYAEDDCDLVYGWFPHKKHGRARNSGSRILKRSGKIFNGSPGEGSSFRLFSQDLAANILTHTQHFVFIDELLLWYTDRIGFVALKHYERKSGKSGYSQIQLFRIASNIVMYYSVLPLRIMTWGGFASSIVSFGIGIYYILRKVLFKVPAGYTSIIVTVLFSTSIIIFSLGIIGEYLNRIYMVQNRKPPFRVKKVLK